MEYSVHKVLLQWCSGVHLDECNAKQWVLTCVTCWSELTWLPFPAVVGKPHWEHWWPILNITPPLFLWMLPWKQSQQPNLLNGSSSQTTSARFSCSADRFNSTKQGRNPTFASSDLPLKSPDKFEKGKPLFETKNRKETSHILEWRWSKSDFIPLLNDSCIISDNKASYSKSHKTLSDHWNSIQKNKSSQNSHFLGSSQPVATFCHVQIISV